MPSRATAEADDGQGNSYCGRLSAIHALMAISEPTGYNGTPLPEIDWTGRDVSSNNTTNLTKSASTANPILEDSNVSADDISVVHTEKLQDAFNTGDTSKRPITDPYFLFKSMDILMGLSSPAVKVCRFDGCEDEVLQIPSDDKIPIDIGEINQKIYSPTGYCRKHLIGSKKCEFSGCDKCSQGSTKFCIKHGGGRRCTVEGCDKGARDKQFCAGHGGGKRCSVSSCNKSAVGGSGHCCVHGGGKKCTFDSCFKSAQSPTQFCVKHGGGKTCVTEGCIKVSRGTTSHCAGHGGGTRCSFRDCNKAAMSSNDVCRIHSGYSNTTTKPKKVKYVKSISNSTERKNSAGYEDNEYDAIHDNSYFVNPIPSDDLYLGPDELFYDDEYPNSDDSKSATIIENHRINAGNKSLQHVSYYPHNSVAADNTCTQSSNGRSLTAEVCVPCMPPVKAAAAAAAAAAGLPNQPAKYPSTLLHTIPRKELSCGSFIERLPPGESDAFEALFSSYRNGAGSEGNRINGSSNISETTSSIGNHVQRIGQDEVHMQRRGEDVGHQGLHQSSSLNDVLQALDRIGKPQYFDTCLGPGPGSGSGSGLRRASVPLAVTHSPYRHIGGTIFNDVGHNYQEHDGHSKGLEQRYTSASNSFPYSSFIQMPLPSLLPASSLLTSLSDNNCYNINRAADNDVGRTLLRQTSQSSCASTSSGNSSSSSSSSSSRGESGPEGRMIDSDHYHLRGNIYNDIRLEKHFDRSRMNALERFPSVPSQIRSQSLTMPKTQGFFGETFPLLRGTETSSRPDASISLGYDKGGVVNSYSSPYAQRNSFDGCVNREADVFSSRGGANISSKSDSSIYSHSHSHSNSKSNSTKSLNALRTVSRKGMSREDMGFSEAELSSPPAVCIEERPRIFAQHGSVSPPGISQPHSLSHLPPMRPLQESTRNGSTRKRNVASQPGSPGAIVGHGHNGSSWTSKEEIDGSVRRDSIDMMDSSFAADILLAYAAQTHHGPYTDTMSETKINRSQPSDDHFHRDSNGQQVAVTKRNFDTVRTIISTSEEHGFGHYARNGVLDQSILSSRQSSTGSALNTRKRIRGDGVGEEVGM